MAKQSLSIPALIAQVPTEADAYALLERLRWDDKLVCPHCGSLAKHYFLKPRDEAGRKTRTGSRSERRVWKCKDCRRQFSVLTGTIFHGTKIPIRTWLMVVFEMCASKNGVAAREIEHKYDLTPKSAWFMTQRIREAMRREPLAGLLSGTVSADETWIGGKPSNRPKSKRPERKRWEVVRTGKPAVLALVVFSQLKRSIDGTHHAVSREHLHRYLAEFDYRYSTRRMSDSERMVSVVGRVGTRRLRLTYKPLTVG